MDVMGPDDWLDEHRGVWDRALRVMLPPPVRMHLEQGSAVYTGGEPPEVVAIVKAHEINICAYAAEWETPYRLVPTPVLQGTVGLGDPRVLVGSLIAAARAARRATYRPCARCHRTVPPESLFAESCCRDCAVGVVY